MSSVMHAAVAQHVVLGLAEVVADRADDAGLGEERRREREVHGRAAEQAVALAGEGLDGVEGDGSDHGERHGGKRVACRADARDPDLASWGGPDVLELVEDAPVPEPADDQVLIRVARAGINFADTHAARELLPRALRAAADRPAPRSPAWSSATARLPAAARGRADRHRAATPSTRPRPPRRPSRSPTASSDARGARAADPGPDRVAPVLRPRRSCARARPSSCTPPPAASARSPSSSARPFGAGRVIATASSEEKRALALELGADAAVDVTREDLADGLREANERQAGRRRASRWPAAACSTSR